MTKRRKLLPETDFFYRSSTTTVYLIHFDRKVKHAQHYIGSTIDLDRRLQEHQRKWPKYALTDKDLERLANAGILSAANLERVLTLCGRTFRRKTTFRAALVRYCDRSLAAADVLGIMKIARKHRSNGLIMTANQLGVPWRLAMTWRANREFEHLLKRGKHAQRLCPICCGEGDDALPDYIPF
jgi:hypothetical protein